MCCIRLIIGHLFKKMTRLIKAVIKSKGWHNQYQVAQDLPEDILELISWKMFLRRLWGAV